LKQSSNEMLRKLCWLDDRTIQSFIDLLTDIFSLETIFLCKVLFLAILKIPTESEVPGFSLQLLFGVIHFFLYSGMIYWRFWEYDCYIRPVKPGSLCWASFQFPFLFKEFYTCLVGLQFLLYLFDCIQGEISYLWLD
jgi:hypothetical protein